MEQIQIIDSKNHVGETVTIGAWVANKRSSGKIAFLQLRDGTAFFQGVVVKSEVPEEVFQTAKNLHQETSVLVTGEIREDSRSKFGYEIGITNVEVVSESHDYPITPKEHGTDFLMDHRHLWLRSSRQHAIMQIRNEIIRATYEFYMEAAAMAFGKVFSFGPTFRAEKSKTRRHLIEFWMIEPEMAFTHQEESLEVQEQYVAFLVQNVLDHCEYALDVLGRDKEVLKTYTKLPFPRITYDDAIELLKKNGFDDIEWGEDFGSPHETFIANSFEQPVFILNYPKAIKPFYMKPHPTREDVVICADMIAPEGYGEIIGGSERATDYDFLLEQIRNHGLDEKEYLWYLDLRKYGSVPHSGFGLGLERTVTWIAGIDHVREAIPFPRLLNRIYP